MKPAHDTQTVTLSKSEYEHLLARSALVARLGPVCVGASTGDLEPRLSEAPGDPSEVVAVVHAFNQVLDQLDAFVRESAAALQAASEGRFHRRLVVRGLHGAFRLAAERINEGTTTMQAQARNLAASEAARVTDRREADLKLLKNLVSVSMSTIEMSVGSANIATATREAQLSSATMASAVEELAASIKDIESAARDSAEAATRSKVVTENGQRLIDELCGHTRSAEQDFDSMVSKTQGLQTSVRALAGVVDVISKIAEQTNLLALNATIEAARAGELGKGFAVVAGEVKSLSRQTRTATETIREQIATLNEAFSQMHGTVDHARESVQRVATNVGSLGTGFVEMNEGSTAITSRAEGLVSILSQQREAVELIAANMAALKATGDRTLTTALSLEQQADANLGLVEGWRAEHSKCDVPMRDVYLAKADHILWKKTVIDFATGRRTAVDELKGPSECRLGRWLREHATAHASAIDAPHRAVHTSGIAAAQAFATKDHDEGFRQYHELEIASKQVITSLDALIRQEGQ